MRTFVSLLSCCTLLIAQTPGVPCPAAATDRERVATAAAATASQSAHEAAALGARPAEHVHAAHANGRPQHERAASHHHANVAASAGAPNATTVPPPQEHGGTCTMLTRCDWVAVPTEPIGSPSLPRFGSTVVAAFSTVPAVGDLSAATPPPKPIS